MVSVELARLCRKLAGRGAYYVCLGSPRASPYTPGHVPSRAHSRHRLIALVGAAPSLPAHTKVAEERGEEKDEGEVSLWADVGGDETL